MSELASHATPRNAVTIDLEEYFQIAHGSRAIGRRQWDRLPSRIEPCTERALALLRRHDVTATFFASAWIVERHPGILRRIAQEGHEVGCRLDRHSLPDVERVIASIEAETGEVVLGCRIDPDPRIGASDRARAAAIVAYESNPVGTFRGRESGARCQIPSLRIAGQTWPFAGLMLRHRTQRGAMRMIARWADASDARPLSFKVWELDDHLPHLAVMSPVRQRLSYRNVAVFKERLDALFRVVPFTSASAVLGVPRSAACTSRTTVDAPAAKVMRRRIAVPALSVVVPCYNEEEGLPYLARGIEGLEADAAGECDIRIILVDDGSTDGTWDRMHALFGANPRVRLIQHECNRGVSAASLTGISAAETEFVTVMDSDCSYDPSKMWDMLPALEPGVALVTASPYHEDGGVEGVPAWRLLLSKGASALYRLVLRNKLATYTSCFRVYRRSAVEHARVQSEGFLGVAELLARLDLQGWRIAEHPVVLERRLFGQSKLKVLRTMLGHLKLLFELGLLRFRGGRRPHPTIKLSRNDLEKLS